MTVDELYNRLQKGEDVILIDARKPEEYAVSHLKGALQAGDIRGAVEVIEAREPTTRL